MFIFGSIYFYIDGVPTISNFVVNRLPTSIDKEVGQEVRKQILHAAPIDENKTKLLNDFYNELNFDTKTKLYVVKGNVFNAFALPDNSIFVFDKVFKDVNSSSELAALLGHEYSHIKYRHSMKGLGQALTWELLASIFSGGDNSDNFVRNSNKLLTLKNSREFETQADKGGLDLLQQKQIDLTGMVDLIELMQNLPEVQDDKTPDYLSTHPATEDRLETIQDEIKTRKNNFKTNGRLDDLLQQLKTENGNY